MSKGKLSVRIPTTKVIQSLEAALEKLNKNEKEQHRQHQEFEKGVVIAANEAMKLAVDKSQKVENIDISPRWDGSVAISFILPKNYVKISKRPELNTPAYEYKAKREQIEQALRILKMTDDETVNTSTYNAISQYL